MASSPISLVEFEHNVSSHCRIKSSRPLPRDDVTSPLDAFSTPRTAEPLVPAETAVVAAPKLRGGRALTVSLQLSLSTMANSVVTGLITIGIVDIATDLRLDPALVYWPVLAYNLTSSPLLIPFGAVADVFGARPIVLLGMLVAGLSVIACGLAQDGDQLIAFRCIQGVGGALFLPTSMGIISTTLASGRLRNIALASLGLSMVIGYALGLVLGGVLLGTIGWRFGYYLCGGFQVALFVLGLWTTPTTPKAGDGGPPLSAFQKLRQQMDWGGALISCACIGMLSYVLALLSEDVAAIRRPSNIVLLVLSILLVPAFVYWMRRQTRHGRPALVPGSLWATTFTTICIVAAMANAEMQAVELLASLFFQNVQELSPLQSSLRLLPGLIAAAAVNFVTGTIVHRVTVSWTLAAASVVAGVAPLLMAVIDPVLPYWYEAFFAQVLYPFSIDMVFVVSALVIADAFPARDQALAGAVFNTVANLGQALGLAVIAILTNAVAQASGQTEQPARLLEGYRAGFWLAFACMLLVAAVSAGGLRKAGAVGLKRD